MFSSNKWNKKEGSPSSFWRKRQLVSLNSSVFIENLPSFERARARARANHTKIDAQKGCAMQLNGITLKRRLGVLRDVETFSEFYMTTKEHSLAVAPVF